jgi:N1221-like protein
MQLLLVLWKTILTCCGGILELGRVKKIARELANLPIVPDEGNNSYVRRHIFV